MLSILSVQAAVREPAGGRSTSSADSGLTSSAGGESPSRAGGDGSTSSAPADPELAARLRLAIARTARRLRQEAGADLSATLTAALATVERHGPLTPSRLAEIERVKRPTATRIVSRLEDEGLVERAADPGDRRSCLISASGQGRDLLRRLRGRKNAYLARRLRELPAADREALERAAEVLERMLEGERA